MNRVLVGLKFNSRIKPALPTVHGLRWQPPMTRIRMIVVLSIVGKLIPQRLKNGSKFDSPMGWTEVEPEPRP